jgi:transposase
MGKSYRSWRVKDLGRPMKLTLTELRKPASTVRSGVESMNYSHERWTLGMIATIIGYKYNIYYSPSHVSRLMRKMGFSCEKSSGSDQKSLRAWEKYGGYPTNKKSINPLKSKRAESS